MAIWASLHNILSGCIFATKACIDNWKKNLLNGNISSMSSQYMANFSPLTAEIGSGVWGTPAHFNWFRVLPSLLQRRRSPEANQTLHDVWPSHGLVHYIYIFGGSCSRLNFARCNIHCIRPSLAFSCIGSVTVRQSSSGRQPKFSAWYKEWNYGTFAEGAIYIHVGHRPTL